MSEYIRRKDAITNVEILCAFHHAGLRHQDVMDAITKCPSINARENVRGEWLIKPHRKFLPLDVEGEYDDPTYCEVEHSVETKHWHCSACDYDADDHYKPAWNFCPNCGADMRERQNGDAEKTGENT